MKKAFQWIRDRLLPRNRNLAVLTVAATQIGVKEWGEGTNPKVEEYLDYGNSEHNKNSGLRDEVPWCAGYVAWCLEQAGMTSTNSLMARSYERWGVSSRHAPLPGDIVTFYRGIPSRGFGHVGFFLKYDKEGRVLVLGGNQNNAVNVTSYSTSKMTDIRRSSKAKGYNGTQIDELNLLVDKILSGVKVSPEGSVT